MIMDLASLISKGGVFTVEDHDVAGGNMFGGPVAVSVTMLHTALIGKVHGDTAFVEVGAAISDEALFGVPDGDAPKT